MSEVKIRIAQPSDLPEILQILNDQLADTSELSLEEAVCIFNYNYSALHKYFVVAIEDDKVIGTGSILIEHKFIHNGGRVGHIEDVAVHPDYCGKGVGREIINELIKYAKIWDCYKVILDCSAENALFYKKCGFRLHELSMRLDLPEAK